jgi:hypothetical protein
MPVDAFQALQQLNTVVKLNGGSLYVTDAFRSWTEQSGAYADFVAGRRKDYVAPPGESWHNAGRACDFDIYHLNFQSVPEENWLDKFWTIAKPLNWVPIISEPNMTLSEAWHFQYLGTDWRRLSGSLNDGLLARAAVLDCGQWLQTDPFIKTRIVQAEAMRASQTPLVTDGQIGPKTFAALTKLGVEKLTTDQQIVALSAMPTP